MTEPLPEPQQRRLLSLDALRGFDMLWIIGAEDVVHQLARWKKTEWLESWATQLSHVRWDGLRAYDLIFPLFMFLSGIALPFSFEGRLARGESQKGVTVRKIIVRTLVLVILGLIYNGLLSGRPGPPRLPSVLGQIGIAWGIAACVQLATRHAWQRIALAAGVIATITVLQLLIPVPGYGAGQLTPTGAINTWLDRALVPGRLHGGTFDPEGLLCIFSASSLTLAGAATGSFLKKAGTYNWRLCGGIAFGGGLSTALGALSWNLSYPPVKALWTGTFDLLAIGISAILFSLFFGAIDVLRWQKWALPLRVIGVNSLTIYLLTALIDFEKPAQYLFGRLASAAGDAKGVVLAMAVVLIEWLLLGFLYRKRIFLRV